MCSCRGNKPSTVTADRIGEKNLHWKHIRPDGVTKFFESRTLGKEQVKLHGGTLTPELKKSMPNT